MTEPSPSERPGLPPPPGEHHPSRRLLLIAVALIALGGGGLFIWDWLSGGKSNDTFVKPQSQNVNRSIGPVTSPAAPPEVLTTTPVSPPSSDELAARIANLEARLSQVPPPASQPAPPSAADSQLAQLQAQVASLETALSTERARADRAEMSARNTDTRLQAVLRMAGALARLRTNLDRGYPFEREYDETASAFTGDANALARLQLLHQWAESGIATPADLRTAMANLGSEVVRTALLEGATSSWQAIIARIKSLIVVRPTPDGDIPQAGTEEGDRPPAIVARAEAKLSDDDVAGAVNELSVLNGAAADVVQAWMAAARARVTADDTMAALDGALRSSSTVAPSDAAKDQAPLGDGTPPLDAPAASSDDVP